MICYLGTKKTVLIVCVNYNVYEEKIEYINSIKKEFIDCIESVS